MRLINSSLRIKETEGLGKAIAKEISDEAKPSEEERVEDLLQNMMNIINADKKEGGA